MSKNDTDEQAGIGLAIVAGLGLEIGKHIKDAMLSEQKRWGIPRQLPNYTSNAAGIIVADRPNQGRVWEVRLISVWVTTPLAAQAGNVAICIGASPDQAAANIALNSECEIPSQVLPFFIHIGRGEMLYRNAEVLYAVLSSAANPGFMSINVIEYDEAEYFNLKGRS